MLRTDAQIGWTYTGSAAWRLLGISMRDAYTRYTARDMGKHTTASGHVHLYLNGLYWGLYNSVERPDAQFIENHFEGDVDDYDAYNARVGNIEVIDGSLANWTSVLGMARSRKVWIVGGVS